MKPPRIEVGRLAIVFDTPHPFVVELPLPPRAVTKERRERWNSARAFMRDFITKFAQGVDVDFDAVDLHTDLCAMTLEQVGRVEVEKGRFKTVLVLVKAAGALEEHPVIPYPPCRDDFDVADLLHVQTVVGHLKERYPPKGLELLA